MLQNKTDFPYATDQHIQLRNKRKYILHKWIEIDFLFFSSTFQLELHIRSDEWFFFISIVYNKDIHVILMVFFCFVHIQVYNFIGEEIIFIFIYPHRIFGFRTNRKLLKNVHGKSLLHCTMQKEKKTTAHIQCALLLIYKVIVASNISFNVPSNNFCFQLCWWIRKTIFM